MAKVYHAEIFGLRETKYSWLNKNDIKKVKWNKLKPSSEFYLFIPQDVSLYENYQNYKKITDILPVNSVGIVTSRDEFVIDFDKNELLKRIGVFINEKVDTEILKQTYNLKENKSWKISEQRKKLIRDEEWREAITQINYRPFDVRWIIYHDEMIERTRKELMQHMLDVNIGLVVSRQTGSLFRHVFIANQITGFNLTGTAAKYGSGYLFPLFIYTNKDKKDLFSEHEFGEKRSNINPELFTELRTKYKKEVTPEEIFYYIYAVLYSNIYRSKYAEFLKIDFPRIPFTNNYKLFIKLGKLGKKLADLHLLKADELNKPISKFSGKGDNKVTKRPNFENKRVYINTTQYFSNVKEEVWNYQIGGYQVCEKWLKDRKARELSLEEIKTYCKIVTALSKTIELQKEIDKNYEGVEK